MAANHNGGPWGGGGGGRPPSGGGGGGNRGGRGPGGDGPQIPEIDEIVKKGQEQLRVLMGGRTGGGGSGGGGEGPRFSRGSVGLGLLALAVLWLFGSFYTVRPEERSVELLFGQFYATGNPGLNFAPWPVVTREIVQVTGERTEDIGSARSARPDSGLMLTRDENIVDIEFQIVWNINDPARFIFNLSDPRDTIRAVAESSMRDIVARSELSPILNRDRGAIAAELRDSVQATLDSYEAGINVIRINFDKADPPREVIDSFREVQAARQERDRLERQADAYANRVVAAARGEAAQILEEAEGYRARVVNLAEGEASRFLAVLEEYQRAPEVTRRRMFIETMEAVLGDIDLMILDGVVSTEGGGAGNGVLPFLPLNEMRRAGGSN